MNLLLLHPRDFIDRQTVLITDYRAHHIYKYLKPKTGDKLRVGIINENIGTGIVEITEKHRCQLQISPLKQTPPPPLPVTLILALPRPLMLKRILQHATSLGVKHIVLLNTAHVEKSYWRSSDIKPNMLNEQLYLGLEQGIDTRLPELELAKDYKDFMQNRLVNIAQGNRVLLVPDTLQPILEGTDDKTAHTTIVIGPERGLLDTEIDDFLDAGFEKRHLGSRTLRVETAVTAAIARLIK
ncbi:MAG: 16S rRNA (uracil(1498)-N(3))-methyltransferase [Pseudomonadales bacterium]|nr:16S rRNA (uracil(1498)-N(3))-methyltransferase [Pseudomonadales bacterium]